MLLVRYNGERLCLLKRLEILVGACFYYSGLVGLARFCTRRSGQKLIILCHHRASGGYLWEQLLYLRRHYRLLHLEAALEELYQPPAKQERRTRDNRTLLVVAFDDGYQDNYTTAFRLARELEIPITIFLVPPYLENGRAFSWLAGEDEHFVPYAQVEEVTIEGQTYALNTPDGRQKLTRAIDERARYPTAIARREAYLATVRQELAVPAGLTGGEKRDLALTWEQVAEMESTAWVSVGAHTMNHPVLPCLSDPLEVDYELRESRAVLEKRLGHPVRSFAYPYGEYGARELGAARTAGYRWAVTTISGLNTAQTDPHQLQRIVVGEHQHWLVIAAKVSGIWELFLRPCRAAFSLIQKTTSRGPWSHPARSN